VTFNKNPECWSHKAVNDSLSDIFSALSFLMDYSGFDGLRVVLLHLQDISRQTSGSWARMKHWNNSGTRTGNILSGRLIAIRGVLEKFVKKPGPRLLVSSLSQ
jgi:hypothetical protein